MNPGPSSHPAQLRPDALGAEALALRLRDQRLPSAPSHAATTLDPAMGPTPIGRGALGAKLRVPAVGASLSTTPNRPLGDDNAGASPGRRAVAVGTTAGTGPLMQGSRDVPNARAVGNSLGEPGPPQQAAQVGTTVSPVVKPKSLRAGEHCHHFDLTQSMPSETVSEANLVCSEQECPPCLLLHAVEQDPMLVMRPSSKYGRPLQQQQA